MIGHFDHQMLRPASVLSSVGVWVWVVAAAVLLFPRAADAASVVVHDGYEFHAALTSPNIDRVLLGDNVTLTLEISPFPSSPAFPATVLDRNVTITSAATAQGPFWLDCGFLDARFTVTPGHTLLLDGIVLLNCRTVITKTFGFVHMQQNTTLLLNDTVDFQGPPSVCIPLKIVGTLFNAFPRPANLPSQTGNSSQQLTAYAPPGSNWCTAAAAGQDSANLPPRFLPLLLSNSSTSGALCKQAARLVGDFARTLPGVNQVQERAPNDVVWMRSVLLCKEPLSGPCVGSNATDACIAQAFSAIAPVPACPVSDAASLRTCLTTPSYTRIQLISDVTLNASSNAFPPSMSENPPTVARNITIVSDKRAPRLVLDCALLADRIAVAPGVIVSVDHLVLSNCSIGAEKPLTFLRFSEGSKLVVQDSFLMQPNDLCLPHRAQVIALTQDQQPGAQPAGIQVGQPSAWCNAGANASVTASADANTSYSSLPPVNGSAAGSEVTYAATLDQPAHVAYYVNPTWPRHQFCDQQVLLLVDYAYRDRFAWSRPLNTTPAAPNSPGQLPDSVNGSTQQQEAQPEQQLPPALVQRLGTGYNSTQGLPVQYINSTAVCQQPSAVCANASTNGTQNACLLAEYSRLDPDAVAGAGAETGAGVEAAAPAGRDYGISVILPAVLASVGGALLLAGLAFCVAVARKRRHRGHGAGDKTPGAAPDLMGVLFGTSGAAGTPSDPARSLLQGSPSPAATVAGSAGPATYVDTTAGTSTEGVSPAGTVGSSFLSTNQRSQLSGARQLIPQDGRPVMTQEDITLSVMIGAGSFGRVYSGSWKDRPVAVKVISHSSADDVAISRELTLSLSFDSPNLVRTLHYARTRINAGHGASELGAPGQPGGSSMFMPQGAVGVFELPTDWAVMQQQAHAEEPVIDTETWIVMDLMDCGTLASAVRRGVFVADSGLRAAMLLRRLADVASGLCYLHSRNVCHGDLKCENVLLRTESQDPDGLMAAVADFGLSRALALGQSHLSTMKYGTVTHQPPELLVAGKLTPQADIYSFGIMMWEVVSQRLPFAGMHHGEVIHKVVTADLRPNPWPPQVSQSLPAGYVPLAEACWSRQRTKRPSAQDVLQQLLRLLAQVEGQQQPGEKQAVA